MRLLVLGGTVFLGHAIAAEAVRRGHDVTCAARGSTNDAPAQLIKLDRDDPDGLAPVRGERFDAVVDVAKISYPHVRRAVEQVKTDHWTFVSSISVYSEFRTGAVSDPVFEPVLGQGTAGDMENYGAIKVASENAARDVFGESAFIVRAGLITGRGDLSDRFGYWPARLSGTGQAVVPDAFDQPTFHIDVADLAEWIIDGAEQRIGGTFNAAGLPIPFGELLSRVKAVVGGDAELVPVAEQRLLDLEVNPWFGPRSLPLWLPGGDIIGANWDVRPAIDAGLTFQTLEQAALNALEHERALGLARSRRAGLTPTEEAEILNRR
ncbi:NAD-dependent epimerase/dehydratase family protein [Kibdelosporangium philippinense]|uniref:NAD-dependent epimerase/dehydratase family protein n=1 Tax=Kibdelosporangium philippinense TaxID=211113 RepID=A0ABS8ZFP1_9PSEU|nr:NAD-dependent epimerase/dehydratase family protein [Kibdelosporangium philippinense]MCE7005343.1 NAD-dependent epimerase/dehydratase family protein [Kibdelosporangium philippinense]